MERQDSHLAPAVMYATEGAACVDHSVKVKSDTGQHKAAASAEQDRSSAVAAAVGAAAAAVADIDCRAQVESSSVEEDTAAVVAVVGALEAAVESAAAAEVEPAAHVEQAAELVFVGCEQLLQLSGAQELLQELWQEYVECDACAALE